MTLELSPRAFYSPEAAAALADISYPALMVRMRQGAGPRTQRQGNRSVIARADLADWLDAMPGDRRYKRNR